MLNTLVYNILISIKFQGTAAHSDFRFLIRLHLINRIYFYLIFKFYNVRTRAYFGTLI